LLLGSILLLKGLRSISGAPETSSGTPANGAFAGGRGRWLSSLLALALLATAAYPRLARWREARRMTQLLDRAAAAAPTDADASARAMACAGAPDPALLVRVAELGPLLASWQTIGGCGAGSATGGGAGIKWVGRGVRGGLFNVLEQGSYTETHIGMQGNRERHTVDNTLITRDIGDKWNVGVNIPLVYKYFDDYRNGGIDVSNGGLGDMSVQGTRKLGNINDTMVTAVLGLPTGTYREFYKGRALEQHQQLGFGEFTGSLLLDHTMDRGWGLIVLGGLASYRGGENKIQSYRAPSATGYAYTGYYLGPFVPVLGLGVTGFTGHDRSINEEVASALFSVAANASLEWSNDWFALLIGASVPYQYDGYNHDPVRMDVPKSPWGFGSWSVGLGLAVSPF
jgi:hypothetical protein